MSRLTLRQVRKSFKQTEVLRGIDLEIAPGELIVFVGPSGCGKSTLLRCIAGLEEITGGDIALGDRSLAGVAPSRRGMAMVFQSYALYPHMDVRGNMAFGLKLMGLSSDEVEARIAEAARMLQLTPLLDRKPRELSGGQRQRVAIGRALVRQPEVFLLDEPLSNLDAALRSEVRLEIAKLHETIGGTTIYVTHDQVEAMTLATRIVVMRDGRIEQVGTPRELFETPANTFVGTFIGSPRMALLKARAEGGRFGIEGSGDVALPDAPGGARALTLGVRPDAFEVVPEGQGWGADVVYTEYLGTDAFLYARLGDGTLLSVRTDPAAPEHATGSRIALRPRAGGLHYFDQDTGHRLAA
ncbi:ABC transporter ATP-binding protein [Wenxinia saemankumensis]|uniref:Multiple sugar transport system ATP-binding protein n=1 Tax=Wenxinia saemankumensis TaxID=1447782 RepID=A0A1M6A2J5_9RHOB|nr:sn-glycerol-3-phosphate ABC transporter ATP-binding protein UgpC [Wenxinia saemankumensis]SHI30628.1 multiple sugar transport system ATP-binding protein [Wenxinia saemankumensis]